MHAVTGSLTRALLAVLVVSPLLADRAHAYRCPPTTRLETSFVGADLVFTADVVTSTRNVGRDDTVTRVRVTRVLRGERLQVGDVIRLHGCLGAKCSPALPRATSWLLFAARAEDGRISDLGVCSPMTRLGDAAGDEVLARTVQVAADPSALARATDAAVSGSVVATPPPAVSTTEGALSIAQIHEAFEVLGTLDPTSRVRNVDDAVETIDAARWAVAEHLPEGCDATSFVTVSPEVLFATARCGRSERVHEPTTGRILRLGNGTAIEERPLRRFPALYATSAQGERLAVAGDDGLIGLRTGERWSFVSTGRERWLRVAVAENGLVLVSDHDATVYRWAAGTLAALGPLPLPSAPPGTNLADDASGRAVGVESIVSIDLLAANGELVAVVASLAGPGVGHRRRLAAVFLWNGATWIDLGRSARTDNGDIFTRLGVRAIAFRRGELWVDDDRTLRRVWSAHAGATPLRLPD